MANEERRRELNLEFKKKGTIFFHKEIKRIVEKTDRTFSERSAKGQEATGPNCHREISAHPLSDTHFSGSKQELESKVTAPMVKGFQLLISVKSWKKK